MSSSGGGPRPMDDAATLELFAGPRWAALCTVDDQGRLHAVPAWVEPAADDALVVLPTDPRAAPGTGAGRPGCVVADEFPTYTEIRGSILRGDLDRSPDDVAGDTPRCRLRITRAHGFSFEGTTTSL